MQLSPEQVQAGIQTGLGFNIDKLIAANPAAAHNLKEEWDSTLTKVTDFCTKYVKIPDKSARS